MFRRRCILLLSALLLSAPALADNDLEAFAQGTADTLPKEIAGQTFLDAGRARFLIGLGAAELFEAHRSNENDAWRTYTARLQSATNPESYLGYLLFAKSIGITEQVAAQLLARGQARYLAIAAAELLVDLAPDLHASLRDTGYFDLRSPAKRREALQTTFRTLYADTEWRGRAIRTLDAMAAVGIRGIRVAWDDGTVASLQPLALTDRELVELGAFSLVSRTYAQYSEPALARHSASQDVGRAREKLMLAAQYDLMFAPESRAEQAFRHFGSLAHDLSLKYQSYAHVLLAPALARYYHWLRRLAAAGDGTQRTRVLRQYAWLRLNEVAATLSRVEEGWFVADKMPLGVHAALGRELRDLRFLVTTIGHAAGWESDLGPLLERFVVNCTARHYGEAEAAMVLLEGGLETRIADARKPGAPTLQRRAAALIPRLVGELREVRQRMVLADKLMELLVNGSFTGPLGSGAGAGTTRSSSANPRRGSSAR